MTQPTRRDAGGPLRDPESPDEDDPAVTDLVARIRRADDPTAALLRPLSEEDRRAMSARVLASLGAPAAERPASGPSSPAAVRARPKPGRRAAAWIAPLAAALALAAGAVLVTRPDPALVAYRVDVDGDADERGQDSGAAIAPVRLRPETKLRVHLAPAAPARDVALRLIVVRDGRAAVISPPALQDGQGGFTIEAAAGALLGEQTDGPIELVFAVGRPLPDDDRLAALALDRSATVPASARLERRAAVLSGFSKKHGALGWSGCKAVRAGPVCEVGRASPIHVWADASDARRFTLRIDAREAPARSAAVDGGLRFTVEPPAGARVLTLSLGSHELLRLPLDDAREMPLLDEADALRREGQLDAAEAKLDEAERDPAARLGALRLRARIAYRRGDGARAAALREEAIAGDRAADRVSDEVDDELARIFDLLYGENALAEAKRRLDAIRPLDAGDAEDRVKLDYYRGLIAGEMGDLRTSIAALRAAWIGARRFAVRSYEAVVAAPLADVLAGLGRYDEAAVILAAMERDLAATADRCDRAQLVMDHGAVLLRAGRLAEAGQRLADAARLGSDACPRLTSHVLTNLAFVRREAGAAAEAKALLAEARAARRGPDAWMDVWQERLSIELSLDGDARAALAAAEKVRRAAEASLSPELLFEAQLGRARALDQLGDAPAAARAYASAERALDAWSALVPLGEGRQAFLARQEQAARWWLDFLRREASRPVAASAAAPALSRAVRRSVGRFYRVLGEADRAGALAADDEHTAALAAYRAARARIDASIAEGTPPLVGDLATVRERQARALPNAGAGLSPEPSPPRSDELALAYHPLPDGGWIGVAWTAAGVTWRPLGRVDPSAVDVASALLEPFRELLARASIIRIYAHRALARVPFHTLPWDGGVLLDRAPVLYGVDLPGSPVKGGACAGAPAALIVADARLDLEAAGTAAHDLEATLASRGYAVRRLQGDAARVDAVIGALADPCVRLFHYDGHAVFQGRDGVDASLLLADGRLSAADILRLPHVPEAAVLSGCSTAEADGLSLAHAFLARGAAEVLATVAPVADATAAVVGRALYEPSSPAGAIPARLVEGWKSVFARVRREIGRAQDLEAYRVLAR